ncbi:DUF452 family protein [Testudinibacter aquarius]|uniref:Biotin synthesis protein BioG n=1 Tax=Testudinibacter aquarius TaxID=1524974 RepID=A0A4R3XY32_9PAST|nr:pimeloyl-ACP methyl esterase BioG family protein [Testudinibacter aquarius]KAE9528463.1 hypothetical protein A1D24_09600 [Testudinibacter aquarius]TCV84226.1 biotin synthesis protein BioG [Testudinibacter aquarius]TNG88572.1 DUF452 family protein [Testudinibacter aquarius]
MQTEWLISAENNPNLILYFAGWGTSPQLVKHWQLPPDTDLLLCWDYRHLSLNADLSRYRTLHLVAWSMGVWAAEQTVADLPFATSVAINGTPCLIDDQVGIPQAIFEGTLDGFNDLTRTKFERRMCGKRELLQQYQAIAPRPTNEIAQELAAVYQVFAHAKPAAIHWQKAIVGMQDQIFPTANQLNYWRQTDCEVIQLALPHFALAAFNTWSELC